MSREELLDALWLARKLPRGVEPLARAVGAPATPPERHGTPHHDSPSTPLPETAEHAAPAPESTASEPTEPGSGRPMLAAAQPRAHENAEVSAGAGLSPAVAVRVPESRLIGAGQLRLGKSLRPLRQRFPDRRRHELDVTRTVAAIADTGVPETVTRPVRTRWLSLALVVDDGVSMVLWQRLAADIRALMERAGAFRDVRLYGLDTRGADPSLRTSPYRHRSRLLSPKTLCDPSGNTLVLVVSDGVGAAWRNGGMRQVMDRWGRRGPTAIVHALPTRLWAGTGIGARRWQVVTHRRGGPTHAWHVTDPDLPSDLVRFDSVPVPVLATDPGAIAEWALVIASPGGSALLPLWDSSRPSSGRPVADTRGSDAAEAVLRFREAASAEAYRLAAHVAAVAPVTPPVMRLVQAALGPPTDPGHLMEVFLGGLMYEVDAADPEWLPHHRRFDFAGDARRVLLSAVSPGELLRTTDAVTRQIEVAVGRAPVFPAWVGHPGGAAVVDDTGRSFGWLREQLLTRLGIPSADSRSMKPMAARPPVPEPVAEGPAGTGAVQSGAVEEPSEQDALPYDVESGEFLRDGWVELLPDDPVRLGRFRLQVRSARGWPHVSMYLARDENDAVVTVRAPLLLHPDDPRAALDLVRTEAECLLRLRGTYAPALVDIQAHTAEELPWIAATCVNRRVDDPSSTPAPNLRAVLDEHGGSVPEDLFLRVGFGLSEALAHAHRLGLVHGSLAPRAVLVTDHDVRLVGWMTATVDGVDSAHRDVLPLSDEYLDAGDGGPTLAPPYDVYAAGALLLALLSGRWTDPRANEERDPLTTLGIGPMLRRTLWRCLEPEPAHRPSAAALAEAFAVASAGSASAGASEGFLEGVAEDILRIRPLARQDVSTHGPMLTGHLMMLSNHLALLGRREESLAAVQEAVQVYRELASEDSRADVAGLGTALSNLSVRLGEVGRVQESLAAISEAETLYREAARRDFGRFGPALAMVLNNLSNRLAATGRSQEAMEAIDRAVDIERRLVERDHEDRKEDLARVLTTLGNRLSELGRRERALEAAREAAETYRDLPKDQVRRVAGDYAVALNNLAVLLGDLGRPGQALSTVDESFAVQRRYGRDLATAVSEIREQSERIRAWLENLLAQAPRH
ncbi:SAV_2336 N-terminal domain-related protein [Streptomyces sp. NPDC018352]|uniref:SAV_2336 N-terminal domain-related protein n=1 Tax=Streptomyces sp. NPDC018352 TaxID=3157194 RepID=UPI0033F68DFE